MEHESQTFGEFLSEFAKESDRGAALVAAAMLDERLENILAAFMVASKTSDELLTRSS